MIRFLLIMLLLVLSATSVSAMGKKQDSEQETEAEKNDPQKPPKEAPKESAENTKIEIIEVSGRRQPSIGQASAASSGTVGYDDFKNRPIARVGELLEVIPGLIATQHSGTGKANQFFLRGFNLDHGTDFASFMDGVPLNMRSHGHGQGYTDLNSLIPELIERVDFKKGPYHAEIGDFGSAGSANIRTYDQLEAGILKMTYGSYGHGRGLVAKSFDLTNRIHLLTAVEAETYDGPFEIEEDLKKVNAQVKFSGQIGDGRWRLNLAGYTADWYATDQIPARAVESGALDTYGSLDPDLGGETTRTSAAVQLDLPNAFVSVYAVDYDFQLFSNFTYFLIDGAPVSKGLNSTPAQTTIPGDGQKPAKHPIDQQDNRGDEFEQGDARTIIGGDARWHHKTDGVLDLDLELGASFRRDDIVEVGLYRTEARERFATIREDSITSTSYSGYAKVRKTLDFLRLEAGLRIDHLDVDVVSGLAENSGGARDTILSPSVSLAARVAPSVELYANYGEGFHSNDARGATITVDPLVRTPVEAVPLLVKSRGAEMGVKYATDRLDISLVGFLLNLESELVYVGDAGTVEPSAESRRIGVETAINWMVNDWATLYASYAYTKARLRTIDQASAEENFSDYIPNAVPTVISAEVKIKPFDAFTSSLILRHVGAAPLTEDGLVQSNATTTLNWGGFYQHRHFRAGVEILNLLNSKDADISYYFESQLQTEDRPVADVHVHPMVPRQIRFFVEVPF